MPISALMCLEILLTGIFKTYLRYKALETKDEVITLLPKQKEDKDWIICPLSFKYFGLIILINSYLAGTRLIL